MPGLAPQIAPGPKTMSVAARIFLALTIVLAVLVVIFKPVERGSAGFEVGQYFGDLLVVLGLPALVAFLVAGPEEGAQSKRVCAGVLRDLRRFHSGQRRQHAEL